MKLLSIILGVCFVFSVSSTAFACPCDKNNADRSTSSTVADAKDVKADAKADATACACGKKGSECSCKGAACDGKSCKHRKDGHKDAHKDGKACDCAHKEKKAKT